MKFQTVDLPAPPVVGITWWVSPSIFHWSYSERVYFSSEQSMRIPAVQCQDTGDETVAVGGGANPTVTDYYFRRQHLETFARVRSIPRNIFRRQEKRVPSNLTKMKLRFLYDEVT